MASTPQNDRATPTDEEKRSFGVGVPLDQLSRAGIFILGGLYTVGLLIVNINLGQYGIFHVELARPEYILVGALWAFLIILTAAALRLVVSQTKKLFANRTKSIAILSTILLFVSVLYGYLWTLWILSRGRLYIIEDIEWSVNWIGVVAVITLLFFVMSLWMIALNLRTIGWSLQFKDFLSLNERHWNLLFDLALSFPLSAFMRRLHIRFYRENTGVATNR